MSLIPGYVNVRAPPYSAAGDGATDDTLSIQNALSDVGALGGGVVFLPTGNYMIATHLSVPAHTSLVGVFRAPNGGPQYKGTTDGNVTSSKVDVFRTTRGLLCNSMSINHPKWVVAKGAA